MPKIELIHPKHDNLYQTDMEQALFTGTSSCLETIVPLIRK